MTYSVSMQQGKTASGNLYALVMLMVLTLLTKSSMAEEQLGEHGFAQSGDVRIHYVTAGKGPLLVMIHGFPDYWFTWRGQISALAKHFQVVAIDQRGYNKSDQPEGVDNYTMDKLAGDVRAVIKHFDQDKAVVVGHDWGGAVAWTFAMFQPRMTERLVILNTPHFNGLRRELANNPQQQKNSAYARRFQAPDAAAALTAEGLAGWVTDDLARPKYVAAFKRSSFEAMLNYYKANYPREPYTEQSGNLPKVQCPVLMIHGLDDKALLATGLNNTWEWVANELTIVTIPDAGHFVQHDRPQIVTNTILNWLIH
jgi:pimeloyl-ACP methyl ester carboxylesterase